jgi:Arc/MetJ-type ribon-helix-helix transcriptional regulator
MANPTIRINEGLKNEIKELMDETERYSTQTEFVNEAVRDKLDEVYGKQSVSELKKELDELKESL